MTLARMTLALCVAASGAVAQTGPYDGEWGMTGIPDCTTADGMRSTCPILTISNGEFRSEGGVCSMSPVSAVPGFEAASVVDFACRGEGDTWSFRGLMHLDVDGRLTMLNEYGPTVYLRMAESPGAPAPVK